MTVGAYGAVMASTYNTRLLVPEVLVDGERYCVVRRAAPTTTSSASTACRIDWREAPG